MNKLLSIVFAVILVAAVTVANTAPQIASAGVGPVTDPGTATEPPDRLIFMSELPVGSLVVDPGRELVHTTGDNLTMRSGDITSPVVWRIVAKNHPGFPDNSITLLTKYLIGSHTFDDSDNRGSANGSARWSTSGTDNATMGMRTMLNGWFFDNVLTSEFKAAVLPTTITTRTRYDVSDSWAVDNSPRNETTVDNVFLPRYAEIADLGDGLVLEYFSGADNAKRVADFPANTDGNGQTWFTRQESLTADSPDLVETIASFGGIQNTLARVSRGVRPMLNIRDDVLVRAEPNSNGHYEIVWSPFAFTTDTDLDGIYFADETISFEVWNMLPERTFHVLFNVEQLVGGGAIVPAEVLTGLSYDDEEEFWYLEVTSDANGRFSISGVVAPDLPFGEILLEIKLLRDDGFDGYDDDWSGISIETVNREAFAIVGLPMEFGDIVVSVEPDDMYDDDALVTLGVPGVGTVTFEPGTPAAFYLQGLVQVMADEIAPWISISYDETDKFFSVWVDSNAVTLFSGLGATIQFEGVAAKLGATGITEENFLQYLDFRVYDNDGELVDDFSSYFDTANVTYDPVADVLTIPVNHFSEYVVALADISELPVSGTNINWLIPLALLLIASGVVLRSGKLSKA